MSDERIYGDIIEAEYSSYWGGVLGRVRCPKCQEEFDIGGCGRDPTCRCGIEWSLQLNAIGRTEERDGN